MKKSTGSSQYKTLLIDASYLAYRVFFALPDLVPGQASVHMVYGFLTSLASVVRKFPVQELIVVWDKGYDIKSQLFPGYKKKDDVMEKERREDFKAQFKLLEDFLLWLGVKCCFQQGFEADDVIAHLCQKGWAWKADGTKYLVERPILIFSGDRDLYPLLCDDVAMYKQYRSGVYTAEDFIREFPGLEPYQYQDMQAFMGCSSDKVPGVKGIGPKRAAALVQKYGSVAKVKDATDEDYTVKLAQQNWNAVQLSAKLVAFEAVSPNITLYEPNLSKLRKHLFMFKMDALVDNWVDVAALSRL